MTLEFFAYENPEDEKNQFINLVSKLAKDDDCQVYLNAYNGHTFQNDHACGYLVIDVLPHLAGIPFDNLALAWIHSLRPSALRVSKDGFVCCDACQWRVTVFLDEKGLISKVQQEAGVGYGCGADIISVTKARKEQREPQPAPRIIGNTKGLEQVDFQ